MTQPLEQEWSSHRGALQTLPTHGDSTTLPRFSHLKWICCHAPVCLGMVSSRGGCMLFKDQIFRALPRQDGKGRVLMVPRSFPLVSCLKFYLSTTERRAPLASTYEKLFQLFCSTTFHILPLFFIVLGMFVCLYFSFTKLEFSQGKERAWLQIYHCLAKGLPPRKHTHMYSHWTTKLPKWCEGWSGHMNGLHSTSQ